VIERVTYQNPDNGYSVLKAHVPGHNDLVPIIGNMPDVSAGCVLKVTGEWKNDPKYGEEIIVRSWEEVMPATLYGIEKYLGSGLIKGIGPVFAKRIVEMFGTDTLDTIENTPEKLILVRGLGNRKVKRIRESWEAQKEVKNIVMFLQKHGASTTFAAKIYKTYGNDGISTIKDNPYKLADDIWGIGFKTADGIAEKLGFGKEDYPRCRSGIMYALNQLANDGHVYAKKDQLISTTGELLQINTVPLTTALEQMIKDKDLILDGEAIYLPPFYQAESNTAKRLLSLAQAPGRTPISVPPDIHAIEQAAEVEYDEIQTEGIKQAVLSKICVLTGGPGTGKTTTTLGIIKAFQSYNMEIILAAPTGRAAKRMTEATGMESKTVHRLLEFSPREGYKRNEETPLEGDVLIVDECSMLDVILMNTLLKAIPPHMRLILVGDIDQLPSVGAGNVLRDIIDSGIVPVVKLTKIFRQAQSSRIITNAHRINQGKMPDISNVKTSDFFFLPVETPEEIASCIESLVKTRLPRAYHIPSENIQVLTPMQRGIIGAANLNTMLQASLNTSSEEIRKGGRLFKTGDKVMQIKNNYDKEVFNGDIGTVVKIDNVEQEMVVRFDGREIKYDAIDLDELVLAYATTIHKSQGSEYPVVVIPVSMTHYIMLQRNLIYTGVTRARKLCVLVGTKKALSYSVRNIVVQKRNTKLKERLQISAEKP